MNFTKAVFLILFLPEVALSAIQYSEIRNIIKSHNQKFKALNLQVESSKLKTGSLLRSYIPEVEIFAGHENFESDPLGTQNTNFYGVEAEANIFNGMSDYWESEKREAQLKSTLLKQKLTVNDMVFLAQSDYLSLAQKKIIMDSLEEGIRQIKSVAKKVGKKVSSGVIAKSDKIAINLYKVNLEENLNDLKRKSIVELNRLALLLGQDQILLSDIDLAALKPDFIQNNSKKESLLAKQLAADSESRQMAANSVGSKRVPKVDLFAGYGRVPFSSREFMSGTDRIEWRAGVRASWQIGDIYENTREKSSLEANAQSLRHLQDYNKRKTQLNIQALQSQKQSFLQSIQNLATQLKLSKNFYRQVSKEYLRGVKSTTDLTTAFQQYLNLKARHSGLMFRAKLSDAEVTRLTWDE